MYVQLQGRRRRQHAGECQTGRTAFAFSTVTARDCVIAARQGKRNAINRLGMKPKT
jgi:hypothetical protein